MAHHKSALKRIRQTKKRRLYNRLNKKSIKFALRDVREATSYEEALEKFKKAGSILDKVASKGILHTNTAANRKSSLSRFVNSLKAQQAQQ